MLPRELRSRSSTTESKCSTAIIAAQSEADSWKARYSALTRSSGGTPRSE
jgi:hypothetical protein